MLKITILASGKLGFTILQQLLENKYIVSAVFTDKDSQTIIDYCLEKDLKTFIGNPRNGKATIFIRDINCDVLLSVNYLFIVEKDLINLPTRYAINIHGSLLPKYRGRTPHVWAIINGEKQTGITAHLMDEKVDNGAIIRQIQIPISQNDTGGSILAKFNKSYPEMIDQILKDITKDVLKLKPQKNELATYFGKRSAKDGRINWDWSKERIRNWVRAQADPYPGAFTFINDQIIIIHQADYSDLGYHYEVENGKILATEQETAIVKTGNGALKIARLYLDSNIKLKKGDLLK